MSLEETIKELKDQLAEEDKKEAAPEPEEEALEEKPEEPKPEEKPEEKAEEKPEEKKEAPEPEPDDRGYAKLRREKAAAERKADESESKRAALEARLAALEAAPLETEEPKAPANPEMDDIVRSHRMGKAEQEFKSLESRFRGKTPEYDMVSAEYAMALAQSIRIQNPKLSPTEIGDKTKEAILVKAANYMKDGFDPIEELFHEAKDLGFTGKNLRKEEPKKEEPAEEQEIRPDMKKLAANRAKSTGMAAAGGKSTGQMTKQAAADLSAEEWVKLPAAEKRRLMYG